MTPEIRLENLKKLVAKFTAQDKLTNQLNHP